MSSGDDWVDRARAAQVGESPPVAFDRNGVVLVAAPSPAVAGDICLQLGIGTAANPVCVVATAVAPAKLESYLADRAPTLPALGFVDATPTRPSPTIKEEVQAIENIPGSRDLLQLTTAVADVRDAIAPAKQPTNIVVPAFDSLLGVAPTDRVVRVLSHIAESNDEDGRVVVGVDYTSASRETLRTLQDHCDAMVWAERDSRGDVSIDFEPLRH